MTSKGKQEMGKTVITRQLQIGDKFKIPGNPSQTYEVVNIKGDYLIYKNVRSHEEFQMVRGFASKVDLVEESATYQKKRFKEPYYMYNESAKTIKESSETKKDYLKYIDQFEKDVKKYIDWMKRDVKENKEILLPDVVINLATAITNAMNRYNNAVKTKTLTEGFMVKQKLGNTYIGRFDSKDKAEKAVKDLAKRRGQSEADWLIEPDDKYMAAATAKGSSSWGPIPMNTLVEDYALITDVKVGDTIIYHGKELKVIQKTPDIVIANDDKGNATKFSMIHFNEPIMIKEANKIEEGFIISDTSTNNKPIYFHYGKYTGYDWGFDKKMATKFSTKEAAERMIEKMRQEGMLINSMKVVSEAFKRNYNFNSGDKLILNTDFGDPTIKSKSDHDPRFNETVIFSKRLDNLNAIVKNTKNSGHMNNSNPDVGEKVPLNILMTAPEYEQWKKTLEGRIAKGYENLDADEKARHLLSHPSSKYMNDLKSENITERAIRKAVKEMLGKPDKRDPQFIIDVNEGCIKESVYYIKSPSGFYVMKTDNSYDLTDDKEKALKYTIGNDAAKELSYIHKYSPDSRFKKLMIVQEEGEAPAIANTTAEVANPDLPLKLKEDLESDKAEALEEYKKAKAEYLANKSDENWKKFSNAKSKCMQLGCRI